MGARVSKQTLKAKRPDIAGAQLSTRASVSQHYLLSIKIFTFCKDFSISAFSITCMALDF
jgi:hypothetical protein